MDFLASEWGRSIASVDRHQWESDIWSQVLPTDCPLTGQHYVHTLLLTTYQVM
jgi:hypothetical protein